MEISQPVTGYNRLFLEQQVAMPELNETQIHDLAPVEGGTDGLLDYINYSLKLSASRKFPYYTATNIDGESFRKAPRKDSWKRDLRVSPDHQWGPELYRAPKSDFDKGHMTKREDVQWGESIAVASKAADSTFFYTNAVPQHAKLNQQIWRSLEDFVLHTQTRKHQLRICVFTGPVLSKMDPEFVTPVRQQQVQIPVLFWKLVVYPGRSGKMQRVGFLMSQSSLLFENGIVSAPQKELIRKVDAKERELFMDFDFAATYQVSIDTLEKLTGMKMPIAEEPYQDERPTELILREVDVKQSLKESASIIDQLGFSIEGIKL